MHGPSRSWERFKSNVGLLGGLVTLGVPGLVATVIGAVLANLGHVDPIWVGLFVFFAFITGVGVAGLIYQAMRPAVQISSAQATAIAPPAPSAAIDFTQTYLRGLSFRITDLARQIPVIEGKVFEHCFIFGPAVLVFTGRIDLQVAIAIERPDDMLFVLEPSHTVVQGPIIVKDCVFRDCHFIGIGVMGQAQDIAQFRTMLTTSRPLSLQPSTQSTEEAPNQ